MISSFKRLLDKHLDVARRAELVGKGVNQLLLLLLDDQLLDLCGHLAKRRDIALTGADLLVGGLDLGGRCGHSREFELLLKIGLQNEVSGYLGAELLLGDTLRNERLLVGGVAAQLSLGGGKLRINLCARRGESRTLSGLAEECLGDKRVERLSLELREYGG
jgi:hypothetical protein